MWLTGACSRVSRRCLLRVGLTLPALAVTGLLQRIAALSAGPAMLLQPVPGRPLAPDFELPDLDGNITRFSDLKGHVVLVNFWATWCPPCRQEIPSMGRAWTLLKDAGVKMLAIHVGGDVDEIWTFIADFNVTFPVLIDKSSKVARAWKTIGLPTTYIVDAQGRKALRAVGGREWDDLALIDNILALRA